MDPVTQKQRLNQLIELISKQEAKLNRLKELRKLAKEQSAINAQLSNELKTVNISLSEKDEELRLALNKVDKLIAYRKTRAFRNNKNLITTTTTTTTSENHHTTATAEATTPTGATTTTPPTSTTTNNNNNNNNSNNNNNKSSNNKAANINILGRRVSFDPLALLLDAALEGELDLVIRTSKQVPDLNASHDECVTALHNAVVADHYDVAKYLIEAGCDINVQDSDGWTPLHCAASINSLSLVKLLIENGALIYATTTSDNSTPAMKCEKKEEGYEECYKYLMHVQDNLGIINNGIVYALYDYEAQEKDELSFSTNEELIILRRDDSDEQEWWWAQKKIQQPSDTVVDIKEGYIPRNLVGLYPRVKAYKSTGKSSSSASGCVGTTCSSSNSNNSNHSKNSNETTE